MVSCWKKLFVFGFFASASLVGAMEPCAQLCDQLLPKKFSFIMYDMTALRGENESSGIPYLNRTVGVETIVKFIRKRNPKIKKYYDLGFDVPFLKKHRGFYYPQEGYIFKKELGLRSMWEKSKPLQYSVNSVGKRGSLAGELAFDLWEHRRSEIVSFLHKHVFGGEKFKQAGFSAGDLESRYSVRVLLKMYGIRSDVWKRAPKNVRELKYTGDNNELLSFPDYFQAKILSTLNSLVYRIDIQKDYPRWSKGKRERKGAFLEKIILKNLSQYTWHTLKTLSLLGVNLKEGMVKTTFHKMLMLENFALYSNKKVDFKGCESPSLKTLTLSEEALGLDLNGLELN